MTEKMKYSFMSLVKEYKTALTLLMEAMEIMKEGISDLETISGEICRNSAECDEKKGGEVYVKQEESGRVEPDRGAVKENDGTASEGKGTAIPADEKQG